MASFAEYAALARHLHDLHRSGAQATARVAEQRGSAEAVADRLDQRLDAQQHRLAALGQAIGKSVPPPGPGGPVQPGPPASTPAPHIPPQPPPPAAAPVAGQPMPPAPRQPLRDDGYPPPAPHIPPVRQQHVEPATGGTSYPEVAGGPARRALPSTSVSGADTGGYVPGQRGPVDLPAAAGVWAADPHRELELARQAADGADMLIVQAETMAQQPTLFPTLSPRRRALAVYGICSAVLAVIIWIMLTAVELRDATTSWAKASAAFGVFAWGCAGLPAMTFFVGYLVMSVWGKPKMVAGRAAGYPRLGFLICFAASPVAFLMYYAVAG
ncbi:hypothetical protein [Plantactinospora sp. B5E13]|uniref:hypothetical protein n=1 Tax=Plantactinospora sp. B5E13 TaxID=3153758 RepID=UPI00325D396D